MEISKTLLLVVSLVAATCFLQARAAGVYCSNPYSKCYRKYIECPEECPSTTAMNSKYKVCYADCDKRPCTSQCRSKFFRLLVIQVSTFSMLSCTLDQLVMTLGSLEETALCSTSMERAMKNSASSLTLTFRSMVGSLATDPLVVPETSHGSKLSGSSSTPTNSLLKPPKPLHGTTKSTISSSLSMAKTYLSRKKLSPPNKDIKIERVTSRNSVIVTIKDKAEIMVNVVPVTKEDDRIHSYKVPSDDCFAHLEVQFKFFNLSPKVDGILGRTYKPDFQNPAKPGVAMPVVGGEDSFKTSSLLSNDCKTCIFSESQTEIESVKSEIEYAALDCTRGASSGYGIVCRK